MIGPAVERIFTGGRLAFSGGAAEVALWVRGERFAAVGDPGAVRGMAGPGVEEVRLEGAWIAPGFHDAHTHLSCGSLNGLGIDLRGATSAGAAAARVQAAVRAGSGWVRGWGWDQTEWPGGRWPRREDLDACIPDRPVVLTRIDGHAAWLNGAALRAIGWVRGAPDPDGGVVERHSADGEPTGIVLERAAELALAAAPAPGGAERLACLEVALERAAAAGLTGVDDVTEPWAVAAYAGLRARGRLGLRIRCWLPFDAPRREARDLRREHPPGDPWVEVATLKVFLDGTLGSRTAALHEPYHDAPAARGALRVDPAALAGPLREARTDGWALALHAIGDLAVTTALDLLEAAGPATGKRPHRIEHVQVARPADLARFAPAGVTASVQPIHARDDAPWIAARLGRRAATAYPLRSLLAAGARVVLGTDWPIAGLDPLANLAAATRGRQECVALADALGPATDGRGIAAGHFADFVALTDDPGRGSGMAWDGRVAVAATYVGGRRTSPRPEVV